MRISFLVISIVIFASIASISAADIYAAETDNRPLINWVPEEEVEEYKVAFIETRLDILNSQPLDLITYSFMNDGLEE
jgi:hypothetical protein